jgi:hypothetical protein
LEAQSLLARSGFSDRILRLRRSRIKQLLATE